jgi:alanyl-tRNA synthetase
MSEDTAHLSKELEESILIDFFLTVGLPAEIVAELLVEIEKQNKKDFEEQKATAKENMDQKIAEHNEQTEKQIKR